MITRLTTTEPESWPTVDAETIVRHSTEDGADICDVAPIGWYGATFHAEEGVLIFRYQKHGNHFADQEDEDGEVMGERADTCLKFLTLERVVELVRAASDLSARNGVMKEDFAERWVLDQIERKAT